MNRRGFLRGLGALLAAPIAAKASILVPVPKQDFWSMPSDDVLTRAKLRAIGISEEFLQGDANYTDYIEPDFNYAETCMRIHMEQVRLYREFLNEHLKTHLKTLFPQIA